MAAALLALAGALSACGPRTTPEPIAITAPSAAPARATAAPTSGQLIMHVVGAVARPGVYALAVGSRLNDAVLAAGGLTAQADAERVNLADFARDGAQLYVPYRGTPAPPSPTPLSAAAGDAAQASGLTNINSATAQELEELPGIGPTLAERIVAYRQAHGDFASIEAIQQVTGIGPACFEQIRFLITVE